MKLTDVVSCAFVVGMSIDLYLHLEVDFSFQKPLYCMVLRVLTVYVNLALLLVVLFNTYPILVGLWDIIAKRAKTVVVMHVVYIVITTIVSLEYMDFTGLASGRMIDVWFSGRFERQLRWVVVHKLAGVGYYLLTYRGCAEFMSPKYTDKEAWVSVARERFNLYPLGPTLGQSLDHA